MILYLHAVHCNVAFNIDNHSFKLIELFLGIFYAYFVKMAMKS